MDDPENYEVRKRGSAATGAFSGVAKNVLNDDAESWILQFRVVALGDEGTERPRTG